MPEIMVPIMAPMESTVSSEVINMRLVASRIGQRRVAKLPPGWGGGRPNDFIARIVGKDPKYKFKREFCRANNGAFEYQMGVYQIRWHPVIPSVSVVDGYYSSIISDNGIQAVFTPIGKERVELSVDGKEGDRRAMARTAIREALIYVDLDTLLELLEEFDKEPTQ